MSGIRMAVAVYHAPTQAEQEILPGAHSAELHTRPSQPAHDRERVYAVAVA